MSDPYDLEGKVVLVTGASRGVGAAIAVAAAAKGAKVACAARSTKASPKSVPGTLEETVEAVKSAGGEALAVPTDLSRPEDIEAMVAAPVQAWGRLDVVVNNAAVTFIGDLDIPMKRYNLIMDINLTAPVLTTRAAVPHMRAVGRGRILSLSSQAAVRPVPGLMAYGMSKLALERMTTDLARQLYPHRIAVNCFRIDIPVASEGTLANMGDVDLTNWEPTSVPADGIMWMLEQPDDYSGQCESMWDLRHRENIMPSLAEEEHPAKPPLQFINGLYDLDADNRFTRDPESSGG